MVDHDRYSEIRNSTQAILFLATPHRGSDHANMLATFRRILDLSLKGTSRLTGRFRSDLVKGLERGGRELATIATDFRHHTSALKIYSFLEQNTIIGLNTKVRNIHRERTFWLINLADC